MDLELSEEQRSLLDALGALLERESTPERVRAAEPRGFDPALWERLVSMGLASMAVPAHCGGGGAGLIDAALVAEQLGRHLAPVPFAEALAAGRLLAEVAPRLLEEVRSDPATLALHPGGGGSQLVPAGAVAGLVVARSGERLLAARPSRPASPANLGCSPVALLDPAAGSDGELLASGPAALEAFGRAVAEWKLLTASSLAGLAEGALELGVSYVSGREQFGVPVGSFQAVQHRLADVATSVEGARMLALEAAWAADGRAAEAAALASMAFIFAAEAAEDAATASLRFHGGYGYMLEYDIQLYFRRAKAWPLVYGDPAGEYERLANLLYGEAAQPVGG